MRQHSSFAHSWELTFQLYYFIENVLLTQVLQAKFVLIVPCPRQNRELKGRDTVGKLSKSVICIHSMGSTGQSLGRQRSQT